MRKWARIESNVVVELTEIDPEGRFHPSLVWVECNEDTQQGYTSDGVDFFPPEPK